MIDQPTVDHNVIVHLAYKSDLPEALPRCLADIQVLVSRRDIATGSYRELGRFVVVYVWSAWVSIIDVRYFILARSHCEATNETRLYSFTCEIHCGPQNGPFFCLQKQTGV